MTETYRLAERTIEITTLFPETHALCAAYRAGGAADFSVRTAQADIDFERVKSAREAELEGRAPRAWPDGYLETLAVYRNIAEKLPFLLPFLWPVRIVSALIRKPGKVFFQLGAVLRPTEEE